MPSIPQLWTQVENRKQPCRGFCGTLPSWPFRTQSSAPSCQLLTARSRGPLPELAWAKASCLIQGMPSPGGSVHPMTSQHGGKRLDPLISMLPSVKGPPRFLGTSSLEKVSLEGM